MNEKEQAIVVQFGKPVGNIITDAGLKFKMPLIQTVIKFDKRILEWDGSANEIPTKDNKYIFIDAFARWKIVDALQFYKSAKNEMLAQSRLDDIIDGAVRDEITNRTMNEIIRSTQRQMQTVEDDDESNLTSGASNSNSSESPRFRSLSCGLTFAASPITVPLPPAVGVIGVSSTSTESSSNRLLESLKCAAGMSIPLESA